MRIDGGCHCGLISFEGDADPERAAICHCTDCQTLSGSAFRTVVPVAGESFKLSGRPTIYVKTAESGIKREQAFCPHCGSPIFSTDADSTAQDLHVSAPAPSASAYQFMPRCRSGRGPSSAGSATLPRSLRSSSSHSA